MMMMMMMMMKKKKKKKKKKNKKNKNKTKKKKKNIWLSALNGKAGVIVGARSALMIPISNLGLIIVDEEHDISFKQQDGLRYNARDVAMVRAKNTNIPIVLGTATPSLESWYNANYKDNKYNLQKLTNRAIKNSTLPKIDTILVNDKTKYGISFKKVLNSLGFKNILELCNKISSKVSTINFVIRVIQFFRSKDKLSGVFKDHMNQ